MALWFGEISRVSFAKPCFKQRGLFTSFRRELTLYLAHGLAVVETWEGRLRLHELSVVRVSSQDEYLVETANLPLRKKRDHSDGNRPGNKPQRGLHACTERGP